LIVREQFDITRNKCRLTHSINYNNNKIALAYQIYHFITPTPICKNRLGLDEIHPNMVHSMKLIRCILLLSLMLQVGLFTPDRLTVNAEALAPAWSPIVISSPTSLTPMPDPQDPLCRTYWYIIENSGGYPAYLTLNVDNEPGSTNSGEWRPNIPTTGFYQIEVYIPVHGTINWDCGPGRLVSTDTNHAQYTITTPSGSKSVVAGQVAGTWVSLGNHFLSKGIGNVLSLSDITGETDFEQLVSFSMARFSWVTSQSQAFFPTIYKNWDQASLTKVTLDSVTPVTREGVSRLRFDMDELVTYRISGNNNYAAPESTRLTWQYTGPCGYGLESGITLTVPVGFWSYDLATTIAACPGQNTATIRIYSRGAVLHKSLLINVDGGGGLQLFKGPAFDVCHLPSVNDMNVWWNQSPYSVVNIYMGGISFASGCNYSGLSRDWIKNVQNIGWGYIPTWVGPQAPCSDLKNRFSFDVPTAYNQGKQEAQLAAVKALQLGLVGPSNPNTILYYDMEGYSYADNAKGPGVLAKCRDAVNWFMKGWVEQLHANGIQAGAYGGTLSSYIQDWWSISPPPDSIWAAEWYMINDVYQYDPLASVKLKYLGDQYWSNHQRVHQYAGDHYETWGGRKLAIDSDVADAFLYMPRFPVTKPPVAADLPLLTDSSVLDFQLLTSEKGWLLDHNKLYWTDDGGKSWKIQAVPLGEGAILEKGFFLDSSQGWLLGSTAGSYTLMLTQDGGTTWQTLDLPDFGPVNPLELNFENALSGIIKFRFQTSQAFREGYILRTLDGGQTWQREALPQDDPVWDGGLPGPGISVKGAAGNLHDPDGAIQTQWASDLVGWARIIHSSCSGDEAAGYTCLSTMVLMTTVDGGQVWTEIYP
jgi:hypothetical protein